VAAVLGSQVFTGAINDLVDRGRDQAAARLEKPLVAGDISPEAALWVASAGLALQLAASLQLGTAALLIGAVATVSALTYNLWLSRTPFSVVPYLVSFGLLPLWVASGVGVSTERVLPAVPLIAPFAAAAHLANVARDYAGDASLGSRSLAQVLGPRFSVWAAYGLALGVGLVVGIGLTLAGRTGVPSTVLGVAGLAAVAQGAGSATRLWYGILVAAVCWTASWALSTGPPGSDGVFDLQVVVLGLFRQLQPDEEPGQDGERDDDQRGQERADADEHDLQSLHFGASPVGAPGVAGAAPRCCGAASIIATISSRVNSASRCPMLPPDPACRVLITNDPSCSKKNRSRARSPSAQAPMMRSPCS
jgi:4-hydroxybenzoate polyprenyltransferase